MSKARELSKIGSLLTSGNRGKLFRQSRTGESVESNGSGPVAGSFSGLKIDTRGVDNVTSVITANQLVLHNGTGSYITLSNVNQSCVLTTSGVGGLDTGASAVSTWYSVWVIYNPTTSTTSSLFSLSATAPTLPSGYTYYARVGWVRTDGTANKYLLQTLQYGSRSRYVPLTSSNVTDFIILASGAAAIGTAVSISSSVPPTASTAVINVVSGASNNSGVVTESSPHQYFAGGQAGTGGNLYSTVDVILTGANVYWYSSGSSSIRCVGWEDNL